MRFATACILAWLVLIPIVTYGHAGPIMSVESGEKDLGEVRYGDKKKAEFVKLLGPDKDRTMVFYCGFTECTRSHNAAMWAVNLGYKNVYRNPGGIEGWVQAGYSPDKAK